MSIYSIYKITNKINNKVYIGYTGRSFERRMFEHTIKWSLVNQAMKDCGIENFDFDIIYQSKDKNHCLNEMEPYFIKEYNSIVNGYNHFKQIGGGSGRKDKPFQLNVNDYEKLMNIFNTKQL